MDRWIVLRVDDGGHALRPGGSSNAKSRDDAIRDVAAGPGEFVAVPARYLATAIVHEIPRYSITARSRKAWL